MVGINNGTPAPPAEYGVLQSRNIDKVVFGDYEFDTWYGNGAYFLNSGSDKLGIEIEPASSRRRAVSPATSEFWIDKLFVCEYCFKYSSSVDKMALHRSSCSLNRPFPPLGKLMYADTRAPYVIKKIRGFRHELFCQNLALFGKLFLDDKSVFYNLDAFDFYVVYGDPSATTSVDDLSLHKLQPMGFFSKEVNSWEADNNLACVCIFPPFQRLRLGSLLIEFSYALARVTPGQALSGPEFPLSPFGKVLYLRYWSRTLAFILCNTFARRVIISLDDLAAATGFRKEDILLTLEHMNVLRSKSDKAVSLVMSNLRRWCTKNHVSTDVLKCMVNPECLLF